MAEHIQFPRFAFTSVNPMYNREIITLVDVSRPTKDASNSSFTRYKALWDTGATNCVVTPKVVENLGLIPYGVSQNRHAGGMSNVNIYYVDLRLPNNIVIRGVRVSECADQAGRFDVIIGMDIISLGDFAITGQGNRRMVSFCMPSSVLIDYVQIANELNRKTIISSDNKEKK